MRERWSRLLPTADELHAVVVGVCMRERWSRLLPTADELHAVVVGACMRERWSRLLPTADDTTASVREKTLITLYQPVLTVVYFH